MTYLVFVEGGETPKIHHWSREKAEVEGRRLYEKLNRPVFVCKVVNAYPTEKKNNGGENE